MKSLGDLWPSQKVLGIPTPICVKCGNIYGKKMKELKNHDEPVDLGYTLFLGKPKSYFETVPTVHLSPSSHFLIIERYVCIQQISKRKGLYKRHGDDMHVCERFEGNALLKICLNSSKNITKRYPSSTHVIKPPRN